MFEDKKVILKRTVHKFLTNTSKKPNIPQIQINGKNVIFVHINKAGGTNMGEALRFPFKERLTATEIINMVGRERWDSSFSFAFVKNPWSKVVSHYNYAKKTGRIRKYFGDLDFKGWIKDSFGKKNPNFFKYENPKMYYPQLDWLTNFSGNICVSFVGRFENISIDFQKINEILETNFQLEHYNKAEKKKLSYRAYYDEETKNIVATAYKKDIEHFRYEF